tara:strand:- start:466 stop:1341 length:876 start_codon:yes stop_codon:yes gene_type:complete
MLALVCLSCKNDPKGASVSATNKDIPTNKADINLNVSLLLDLSDRIDTIKYPNESMEFYLRDLGYIESISNAFVEHLSKKKLRVMDDKIAVFFSPEPKNPKINTISQNLKFHVTKNNATLGLFENIKSTYSKKSKEIYEQALTDGQYIGSDTWSFFKNKVETFCIDDDSRNLLIILTDGYLYYLDNLRKQDNLSTYLTPQYIKSNQLGKSDWKVRVDDQKYGFIPAAENLGELEILVLGINPSTSSVYDDDVIKTYWQNWFEEMGVGYYELRNAELPSDMDPIIREFINRK